MNDDSPIIFYYYFDLSNTESFCRELERRFRETGHSRRIEFRSWNCYNEEPGRDGDLFSYDCIVLSALKDKGYIRELPDIIDVSDVFEWVRDGSRVGNRLYGIPIMGCCDTVICRRADYKPFRNIFEIDGRIATHLKGQLFYFYLQSFCNCQGDDREIFRIFEKIRSSMADAGAYGDSLFSSLRVAEDFISGRCPYFIGFSENLRFFPKDDYIIRHANFSDRPENDFPMCMVDMVSMGRNVSEEKLLDCLDILEILSDADFVYGMCKAENVLQYMLPVNRRALDRLVNDDPDIYRQLRDIISGENNCVLRYGKDFYELIHEFEADLRMMMDEREA